jgi:hypothetical protein
MPLPRFPSDCTVVLLFAVGWPACAEAAAMTTAEPVNYTEEGLQIYVPVFLASIKRTDHKARTARQFIYNGLKAP